MEIKPTFQGFIKVQRTPLLIGLVCVVLIFVVAPLGITLGSRRGNGFPLSLVFAIFALVALVVVLVSWLNLLSGKYAISISERGVFVPLYMKWPIPLDAIKGASLQPLPANMRMQIGAKHRFNLVLALEIAPTSRDIFTFVSRKTLTENNGLVHLPIVLPRPYYEISEKEILKHVRHHIA